jgi:hypothetical protein
LLYWPQQVMKYLQAWPYGCELAALQDAAVAVCDGLDGVDDGVIAADADECLAMFDPFALVGAAVEKCPQAGNRTVEISHAAAVVANETWHGPVSARGKRIWHGLLPGADIGKETDTGLGSQGVAAVNCSSGTCVGSPHPLTPPYFSHFLALGDTSFDLATMARDEFDWLVHLGHQILGSALDTNDPDLTRFRDAGGKLITWHGLVCPSTPPHKPLLYIHTYYAVVLTFVTVG